MRNFTENYGNGALDEYRGMDDISGGALRPHYSLLAIVRMYVALYEMMMKKMIETGGLA